MIPVLYESTETTFTSNGVGRLAECTSCMVTEERNGVYELELTYPVAGKYYNQITEGMIISATHDDTHDRQPFRIYRRSAPINGLVTFNAHHISYDLNHIVLDPFTASSVTDAFAQIEENMTPANSFEFWTDKTTSATFTNDVPSSVRSKLGGSEGSILDVYGGEYKWDGHTVRLYNQRGRVTDISIRYGKNLTDITQTIDVADQYTGIAPYWYDQDEDRLITLPEKYVIMSEAPEIKLVAMDFSDDWQEAPTVEELRAKAQSYLNSNKPWLPDENIKISFVQLWQTEEYKDVAALQRLGLCDRVNVYYPPLGITVENVEIIKVVYNVLLERYDEMELGDARSSLAETLINPVEDAIKAATQNLPRKSYVQQEIDRATDLITGGMGGHIVFVYDADGKPVEMLVMDTEDTATAVNVLRINVNGIGFSSTGINGPYTSAWTLDGRFVADFITAGTMLANRIQGGTLTLGGIDNGNGILRVVDEDGNEIGRWTNTGLFNKRTKDSGTANEISVESYIGNSYEVYHNIVSGYYTWTEDSLGNTVALLRDNNGDLRALHTVVPEKNGQIEEGSSTRGVCLNEAFYCNGGTYKKLFTNEAISNDETYSGQEEYRRDDKLDTRYLNHNTSKGWYHSLRNDAVFFESDFHNFFYTPSAGVSNSTLCIKLLNNELYVKAGSHYFRLNNSVRVIDGNTIQVTSSSKRYKHDITDQINDDLDPHRLYDLKMKQFVYNDDHSAPYPCMNGKTIPGFIAEEVAKVYPAAVIRDPKTGQIESWSEAQIIPGMLALIQEQKKTIDDLEARVAKLEEALEKLI